MPDGLVTMAKLAAKGLSTDLEVTGSVGCHFSFSPHVMSCVALSINSLLLMKMCLLQSEMKTK